MASIDAQQFHKIYGPKRTRMSYQKKDFVDYVIMTMISVAVVILVYGLTHPLTVGAGSLGLVLIASFFMRHGAVLRTPVVLKRPQDLLYLLLYKLENMKPMYLLAIGVFILEKVVIQVTPDLPHNPELMRSVAMYLFLTHFVVIMVYRSAVLVSHLKHRRHVKEFLLQTTWKGAVSRQPSITVHILHAYISGVFTHIVFIAPWYFVVSVFEFSTLLAPLVCVVNAIVHIRYMKSYNAWFYRDHWLGHNSEMDFIYLHGTHHDAIPCGLIGVSGNGHLEGFLRHTLGNPMPLYNPIISFLLYTIEVLQDIKYHQYVPGLFPRLTREFHEKSQHSTHHFGMLEPYSIGFKGTRSDLASSDSKDGFPPQEILNSIELDERLGGFEWDNKIYKRYMKLFDRYQKQGG